MLAPHGLIPINAQSLIVGAVYGRLLIVGLGKRPGQKRSYAICRCACGSPERCIRSDGIKNGTITSCGCAHLEAITKHGCWSHTLYTTWHNMMRRCYEPKTDRYPCYGARGISVCSRWHDVRNFITDMEMSHEAGLELDRIDNDGNYEPANCRWVTHTTQARSKRNLRLISSEGRTMTAAEWARERGINYGTVLSRMRAGWSEAEAISIREDCRRTRRT